MEHRSNRKDLWTVAYVQGLLHTGLEPSSNGPVRTINDEVSWNREREQLGLFGER